MMEDLQGSLGVLFFNDIDIEFCTDTLLNDFRGNCIIFSFSLVLGGGNRFYM